MDIVFHVTSIVFTLCSRCQRTRHDRLVSQPIDLKTITKTHKEITHFWCVCVRMCVSIGVVSSTTQRKFVRKAVGGRRIRCGKYLKMSKIASFTHEKRPKGLFRRSIFNQHTHTHPHNRFVIVIIFGMGVRYACVNFLVLLNDTYLNMILFVTDTMPFVIFKRSSAARITTCVSTFCCDRPIRPVRTIYLCVLCASLDFVQAGHHCHTHH